MDLPISRPMVLAALFMVFSRAVVFFRPELLEVLLEEVFLAFSFAAFSFSFFRRSFSFSSSSLA